jgi:UDP-glucose 4-epimerase
MVGKVPVLVTGGAGYIGSHAVLALKDAGWDVTVIDNLVTGFAFAVPDSVPLYQGDIEDGALLARIFAERGSRRSCISPDRWWCPNRSRIL